MPTPYLPVEQCDNSISYLMMLNGVILDPELGLSTSTYLSMFGPGKSLFLVGTR